MRWNQERFYREGIFETIVRRENFLTFLKSTSLFILKTTFEGNKSRPYFTEA